MMMPMTFSPKLPVNPMHHSDMTNPATPKRTHPRTTTAQNVAVGFDPDRMELTSLLKSGTVGSSDEVFNEALTE